MLTHFGTYTKRGSRGIYTFDFDLEQGTLTELAVTEGIEDPSFLDLHPTLPILYAVAESGQAIACFRVDRDTGQLERINQQDTGGGGSCHVRVDPTGSCVVVANYGGGSVACLPLDPDGHLQPRAAFIQHQGSSVTKRQQGPHAHCSIVDPTGRFVIAADLGLDQLLIYQLDPEQGTLKPHDIPHLDMPPGAGPRHLAFHPDRPILYCINELDNTLSVCPWDADAGALHLLQSVSTLPLGFDGKNTTAEVAVHPNGRFVYGSNRGHDSLATFAVDPADGTLQPLGHIPAGGEEPRHFGLTPDGGWLLACHQNSDTVQPFRVDPDSGKLTPHNDPTPIPAPVCVKFAP